MFKIFPLFLRTFEEHLKRQIQDSRKIEHFFQVCLGACQIDIWVTRPMDLLYLEFLKNSFFIK